VGSIIINYFLGIWMQKARDSEKNVGLVVTTAVAANLLILFSFKYLPFAVTNLNTFLPNAIPVPSFPFPLGISFFTFQAISYIMDVKRGRIGAQKNFIDLALYISFFPRLLQGPIVRYQTMVDQLRNRKENFKDFSEGCCRFVIGLGKKVLVATLLMDLVNSAFASPSPDLSVSTAWLGMFAASFYIYFDFSGYSDMAIGLGKMFGFKIPENFNYPYIASTIADYWRRWHMTMMAWFKDYVFLPVAIGQTFKYYPFTKKTMTTPHKIVIAMFITWLCTGIWHGASWNFVIWGMYFFVLMQVETMIPKFKSKFWSVSVGFILTQLAVKLGQVLTRSTDINQAWNYYLCLFGLKGKPIVDDKFIFLFNQNKWILLIALIASMPTVQFILKHVKINKTVQDVIYTIWIIALFVFGVIYVTRNGYTPFLYGKF
jgi:alginate O-acetyltransferase complex protein AlgI